MVLRASLVILIFLIFAIFPVHNVFATQLWGCSPQPDFVISTDPDPLVINPGSSGRSIITLTSVNGFAATVRLESHPEAGLSSSLNPTSVSLSPSESVNVTLDVLVPATTPPGAASIIIFANLGIFYVGVHIRGPEFSLTPDLRSLSVRPGEQAATNITVRSLDGFSGNVSLQIVPFPLNPITASLNPTNVTLTPGGTVTAQLSMSTTPFTPSGFTYVVVFGRGTFGATSVSNSTSVLVTVLGLGFEISAAPSVLTIQSGTSSSSILNVSSLNGFEGAVRFRLSCSPIGPTATLSTLTVSLAAGGSTTLSMQISVPTSTHPGTYQIRIQGSNNLLLATTNVTVIVPEPDFALTASPENLSVRRGSSGAFSISVTSLNGFSGIVGLKVTIMPLGSKGPTITLSGNTFTLSAGASSTVTLTASAPHSSLGVGTYYIEVIALRGSLAHSITVKLQVSKN